MTLLQDPPTRTGHPPAPGAAVGPAASSAAPGGPGGSGGPGGPGGRGVRPGLLRFTASVGRGLEVLAEDRLWSLSDAEVGQALVELTRQAAQLEELRLRVLVEADARRVGADQGATSACAWLAHQTKETVQGVFADLRLGQTMAEEFETTRAAMAGRLTTAAAGPTGDPSTESADTGDVDAGAVGQGPGSESPEPVEVPVPGVVDAEKARIIIRAVNGLSVEHGDLVTPEVRRRAEAHLVDLAARFDAPTLTKLSKRLIEVVCPEAADAAEGGKLDAEEQAARRKAFLQVRDNGGRVKWSV